VEFQNEDEMEPGFVRMHYYDGDGKAMAAFPQPRFDERPWFWERTLAYAMQKIPRPYQRPRKRRRHNPDSDKESVESVPSWQNGESDPDESDGDSEEGLFGLRV
jgi:hypothetical protein